MKSVDFHPEAEAEFIAAAQYYEGQAENPGLDFISAVERSYQRQMTFPESGHPFGRRRKWLSRRVVAANVWTLLGLGTHFR